MHFGFALELSDTDLWNIDLLDTHLDLLSPDKYTDIPSMYFVCLHNIFKTSSDIPSKYFVCLYNIFKTSSKHAFKMSWRRLQGNNFLSSKTSSRRLCKVSSRRLQDVLEDVGCWDVWKSFFHKLAGWYLEASLWITFFIDIHFFL